MNVVQAKLFDSDLLIVTCGRFIQYGKLDDSMFDDDIDSVNEFKDMKIDTS